MSGFIEDNVFEEEDTQKGKVLAFTVGDNIYGLPIKYVTEIIGVKPATKVPATPDYAKGIINLRGRIVPLLDIRIKFGKEEMPYNERTCIIVIDVNTMMVGLIVDKVDDILKLEKYQITPPPPTGVPGCENRYIEGISKMGDNKVLLLLDAENLLENEEMEISESITANSI